MNKEITLTIEEEEKEIIKNYLLENISTAIDIAKEANSYRGTFDWVDTWDLEELSKSMDAYDLVRAVIYGNVNNIDDEVRFNGYGNLESISEFDLESDAKSEIDDIIEELYDLYPGSIYIYDQELVKLLNKE